MKSFAIVSGYLNHYQVPMADYLYQLCDKNFYFIETTRVSEERKKGGFKVIERPYCIRVWEGENSRTKAMDVCLGFDILLVDTELTRFEFKYERLKRRLLTLEISERPLKKGFFNVFSKTNLKNQFYYHMMFHNTPLYRLCIGAYVANDLYSMFSYKGRCYKFGYISDVQPIDIERVISEKNSDKIRILWCARFISWKHPEMMLKLAIKLKSEGKDFEINMVGIGEMLEVTMNEAKKMGVDDCVHFLGGHPNREVLQMMREHHIFVLTSDRHEGWGVVVNEAMANGCCVVGADEIGSIPSLIKNGVNGTIFRANNDESLFCSVNELIENRETRESMTREAYRTIYEEWRPEVAAKRILKLAENLKKGQDTPFESGLCSKVTPYK